MHYISFPGCCTAKIVTSFGQTSIADGAYRPRDGEDVSQASIERELEERCWSMKRDGMGIATAITNDDQVEANAALEAQGWESSRWCTKGSHSDKRIKLWFKCLMDLEE